MPKRGEYKKGAKKASIAKRKFNSSEEQKNRRVQRNTARRRMEKAGKVHKGDGKEVDHVKHKARGKLNNSESNLRVIGRTANRKKNLGTGGRPKGS
jgi:hypothetical protein